MRYIILTIILLYVIIIYPGISSELTVDANTLLLLHFNGTTNGADGEKPTQSRNISYGSGVFGQTAYFGSSNQLFFNSFLNINPQTGTVEFWMKPQWSSSEVASHYILTHGQSDGFSMMMGNIAKIIFNQGSSGDQSSDGFERDVKIYNNEWHHYAFTWDQNYIKFYIDGKLKAWKPTEITLPNVSEATFQIGASFTSYYLNAYLDEFRISNVARSVQEIEYSYYQGIEPTGAQITPNPLTLKPTWEKTPDYYVSSNVGIKKVPGRFVRWSSSEPNVATIADSTGKIFAVTSGTATITGVCGTYTSTALVNVESGSRSSDPGDIDVQYISRTPLQNYVWKSNNPKQDGWPTTGQQVTWSAYVKNRSKYSRQNVSYQWLLNNIVIASGTIDLPAFQTVKVDYLWTWTFTRNTITFKIDPNNIISEEDKNNNQLTIISNALSLAYWVEESIYNYYREYQHQLPSPIQPKNSFEDMAQRHITKWNNMFANAIYPETETGVQDRLRLNKIVVVPDSSLPLTSGVADLDDRSVDYQWAYNYPIKDNANYQNHTDTCSTCNFWYDGEVLKQIGKVRYLTDLSGFDVQDNGKGNSVAVTENGTKIAGSKYLPFVDGNYLYKTPIQGVMHSDYSYIDRYSAACLNLIAGERNICNGCQGPVYLNDLPEHNRLTIYDTIGNPLPNTDIKIFNCINSENYTFGKYFDNVVDYELSADSLGRAYIVKCPFSSTGTASLYQTVLLVRLQWLGIVEYKWMDISSFNLAYWRGQTDTAKHSLSININPMNIIRHFNNNICAGASIIIDYNSNVSFGNENNFILELSDADGNFTNPVEIGSLKSPTSGRIIGVVPDTMPSGTKYQLRLLTSSPKVYSKTYPFSFTILARPKAEISGTEHICYNNDYKFAVDRVNPYMKKWEAKNALITSSNNQDTVTIRANQTGEIEIKLILTDLSTNCKDTLIKILTVNTSPIAEIRGKDTVCSNENTIYSYRFEDNCKYTVEVENGTLVQSSDSVLIINWNSATSGKLKLNVVNEQTSCSNTTTYDVIINIKPNALISGDTIVFENSEETYTVELSDEFDYFWLVQGGDIIEDKPNNLIKVKWGEESKGTIYIIVATKNGACIDTCKRVITIIKPEEPYISGKNNVCDNSIEVYRTVESSIYESYWYPTNGDIIGNNVGDSVLIQWYNDDGIVKLVRKLISSGAKDSTTIIVYTHEKPAKPVITQEVKSLKSSADTGNQWFYENQKIDGAVLQFYQPENDGYYSVLVTDQYGCVSEMSETYYFQKSGIEETQKVDFPFSIYPNPAGKMLYIRYPGSIEMNSSIYIYDILGVQRYYGILNNQSNSGLYEIKLNNFTNGIYNVIIRSGNNVYSTKLIVM